MFDTFAIPWTVAHQAPLSMGFPRQEYWSGQPFPSPRDLPDPGIEPMSPAQRADSLLFQLLVVNKKLYFYSNGFSMKQNAKVE